MDNTLVHFEFASVKSGFFLDKISQFENLLVKLKNILCKILLVS